MRKGMLLLMVLQTSQCPSPGARLGQTRSASLGLALSRAVWTSMILDSCMQLQ